VNNQIGSMKCRVTIPPKCPVKQQGQIGQRAEVMKGDFLETFPGVFNVEEIIPNKVYVQRTEKRRNRENCDNSDICEMVFQADSKLVGG
jgi:hypothetical protein